MQRRFLFAAALSALLAAPALLPAKGKTVKVVLDGGGLTTPAVMDEPGIEVFGVWEGPGVRVDGVEQDEGFIVDWRRGAVSERPAGLPQYKVSFYAEPAAAPRLVYSVYYEFDPATRQGYVYLPPSSLNGGTIHRGVEGNWFRATAEWQDAVRSHLGF
jgi:hypothetical protein